MPEFEETNPSSSAETYAPSTDAKPRSRRRSGGFKKEQSTAPSGNIGEIDPVEALRGERLSGESNTPSEASQPRPVREEPRETENHREDYSDRADPQPTEETLATVKRVEARILERKAGRDARHQARKQERAANPDARPKRNAPKKSGGFFAAILKLFGLGPKTPARKGGGRSGSRSGGRPNQRGGQNRGSRGGNRHSRGGRGRNPRGSGRRD